MHSLSILLPFLAPVLLTSASPVPEVGGALDVAPDSLPKFSSVQYSGSGCPSSAPGVVRTGAFADPAFRLNGFEAKVPDGTSSVNCQVHIEASGASAGWQVGLDSVSVRGHLVLDPGATLDWFVTSFFSQDADRTVSSTFHSIYVFIPPISMHLRRLARAPMPLLIKIPLPTLWHHKPSDSDATASLTNPLRTGHG